MRAELTRAARQEELDCKQDWHVWGCALCCRELECGWQSTSPGHAPGATLRRLWFGRYVGKEFTNTESDDFLSHPRQGGTLTVAVPCCFWMVVKQWKSQNLGSGRAPVPNCRPKPACGAPARGACTGNVCTTASKIPRHPRRTREMGSLSRETAGEHGTCEGWPARAAIGTPAKI